MLAYADFSLPFILEVDANHGGLGAMLPQEKEGKMRPMAYARRGLRPTERNMVNYSSMKLEFLALKWVMTEKFREYLFSNKCVVSIPLATCPLLNLLLLSSDGQLSMPLLTLRLNIGQGGVTDMLMPSLVSIQLVLRMWK